METIRVITCIVQSGKADAVVTAAMKAGAEGATTFSGTGTGVRQRLGKAGAEIEPDKEIIIIASRNDRTNAIFEAMVAAGDLGKPGMGFIFLQTAEKAIGFLD